MISGGSSLTTTQSWKYNALGLLAHHYHLRPSGASPFVVSYGYDSGSPVTEYANGIPMVTGVRYQPSGAVSSYTTGINTGRSTTTTIVQDTSLLARPSQIYATAQGLRPFDTSGYVYDGAGNIKSIGSDTFVYDNRSRLTSTTYSGFPTQGYSYDRYGNLLTKGATTYSVSSSTNRLTTSTYDSRGNLTVNGGETYAYDGLDRQIRHTAAGSSWNYIFDGLNERVAKAPPAGGAWTYTLRDEGNRVATEYSGATQSRDNVFLGNLAVVSYANSAVAGNGPVWTFYSSDHLGTPRLVTDIAGATVETRKSWPYGEDVGTPGTFQKLRFALMERDTEASRYYDHARSHEFGLGRFLGVDALQGRAGDPQTWNRYAYARSNPIKFVDSDGKEFGYPGQQRDLNQVLVSQAAARGSSFCNECNAGSLPIRLGESPLHDPLGDVVSFFVPTTPAEAGLFLVFGGIAKVGGPLAEILRPGGRLIGEAGTSPSVRILKGTADDIEALFGRLAKGGKAVESRYPGKLVELPDGTRVGLRSTSKTGGPTIDIVPRQEGVKKIHLKTPDPREFCGPGTLCQ